MKRILIAIFSACLMASCTSPKVDGHYNYQHGWNYDIAEGHVDVHETGTMDFYPDGSALDSANQVYRVMPTASAWNCLRLKEMAVAKNASSLPVSLRK